LDGTIAWLSKKNEHASGQEKEKSEFAESGGGKKIRNLIGDRGGAGEDQKGGPDGCERRTPNILWGDAGAITSHALTRTCPEEGATQNGQKSS